jgi:hypothetical protein
MSVEDESVSKKDVFAAVVASATEFYKTVLSVATLFLGGTLVFIEKLTPGGASTNGKYLLGIGWVLLICSICCVALVQRWNLESGKQIMEGQINKAQRIDKRTSVFSSLAIAALILGISFLMSFGYMNLDKDSGGVVRDRNGNGPDSTKTIPFGSTQPVSSSTTPGNSSQPANGTQSNIPPVTSPDKK